uniref:Variant surface glycoprotein 1244 n=1 Tax=Trypanosoma brucei TaxID=5691 RepID=M4SVW8_9TRYP|nr:variant surface glycoprotein 1244 [Trypanosoma brucei]
MTQNHSDDPLHWLALLIVAILGTKPDATMAAEPTKGENAEIYRTLCTAVNALDNADPPEATVTVDSDSRRTANLLKLFLRDASTITALAEDGDPKGSLAKAEGNLKKLCENNKQGDCADAADYLKTRKGSDGEKLIKALTAPSSVRQQINRTVEALSDAINAAHGQHTKDKQNSAKQLLKTAVMGTYSTPEAVRLKGTGSSRQGKCGTNEATQGTAAGATIAGDLLCICGSNSGSGNKGCLTAGAGQVTYSNEDASQGTVFKALQAGCKNFNPNQGYISGDQLRDVATTIMHMLNDGHGDDDKISYLGKSDNGANAAGCDGDVTAGKGACVIYGKSGAKPNSPGWMQPLLAAAAALDDEQNQKASAQAKLENINSLNRTLTNLLHLHNVHVELSKEIKQSPKNTATEQSTKTLEETNRECTEIKQENQCKRKAPICEWKGKMTIKEITAN